MAKNIDPKATTPADVVAEAKKADLLKDQPIPAQEEKGDDVPEQDSGVSDEGQKCDGSDGHKLASVEGNLPLKDRLKAMAEKVKANKKNVAITVGVVGAAALVFVKIAAISAAKTVAEEIMDVAEEAFDKVSTDEEQPTETDAPEETVTEVKVTKTKTVKA